jgi:hypothetical protein
MNFDLGPGDRVGQHRGDSRGLTWIELDGNCAGRAEPLRDLPDQLRNQIQAVGAAVQRQARFGAKLVVAVDWSVRR